MAPEFLSDIGERVRAAREGRGMTQRELAEATGLSQSNIWEIEHGKRDLRMSTFWRIKEALEVSASDLVDDRRH